MNVAFGFRTTVISMPTKSAEMGNLQDLNPGQAPLPTTSRATS